MRAPVLSLEELLAYLPFAKPWSAGVLIRLVFACMVEL
jgi:hypothetical protein